MKALRLIPGVHPLTTAKRRYLRLLGDIANGLGHSLEFMEGAGADQLHAALDRQLRVLAIRKQRAEETPQ